MDTATDFDRLGQLLKEAREHSGMSQRQTAEAANISPTYVRAIESRSNPNTNKPSRPSPAVLRAMGNALNVNAETLLNLAGYDSEATKRGTVGGPTQNTLEWDLKRMKDAARKLNQRHPFIRAQSVERFSKFSTEFAAMADGTVRCTAVEEPYLTRMAYRQATSTIMAVSYQDEKWWTDKRGRDYLKLHDEVCKKGVEVTRIFLVPEQYQPALLETFEKHLELGIQTFVMAPSDVKPELCRDFVLFDEELLRVGSPSHLDDSKTAEFTDNPVRIDQAQGDFRALHRIALNTPTEVKHILEQWADEHELSAAIKD